MPVLLFLPSFHNFWDFCPYKNSAALLIEKETPTKKELVFSLKMLFVNSFYSLSRPILFFQYSKGINMDRLRIPTLNQTLGFIFANSIVFYRACSCLS